MTLRRQRQALALAVALGDLSGELTLEQVTELLSDFADAIDRAVKAAIGERTPDAEPRGFAVIAMGKLGSHELNYSSDVDLLLLFDPETLPKRARDDAGEAAVRIGRRLIEIMQKRTEDGYVQRVDLRLRPSPEVTPIALPLNAAISHYEFERAAVGAGSFHSRPGSGGRRRAWAAIPRCDPALRLAPLAGFRRDRGGAADFGANPRPFRSRGAHRSRL